jgi:hypothetical protein
LGIEVETTVEVPIPPAVKVGKVWIPLYSDPCYSKALFPSPDLLERRLMELVMEGRGEYALEWVKEKYPAETRELNWWDLPSRAGKVWLMR